LLIRADGYAALGTGHVMRCLALAHAWQDAGGSVRLAAARLTPTLKQRLADEGVTVVDLDAVPGSPADAAATARCARDLRAGWIVADGYGFDAAYQRAIKDAGLNLLLLDDYGHAEHYHADLVLNQNLHAEPETYAHRDPGTRLLLGTAYALLRREFTQWRDHERQVPETARRVLVTFGGTDPHDLAAMAIRAVHAIEAPALETTVVAGSSELQAELAAPAADGPQKIEVLGHITDMPDRMARADLAVATAGSTSWERALLRLPSLVVVVAENQRPIGRALQQAGAALDLGWWSDVTAAALTDAVGATALDAPLRQRQADAAGTLVDGRGAERVLEAMAGGPPAPGPDPNHAKE
jgi:UDP-2,4-diacetamido-2,4,6-trideoxy-beta-L-altropyranose hydrolase